jgi:hypothetical protein
MDAIEQKLRALDAFKDWSNYLLVTTVAALGWVSTKDAPNFRRDWVRALCIWSFALSVLFAILTLGLLPHIEELSDGVKSIYDTSWHGWFGLDYELFCVCFPQHVLFLVGVILYAYGTTFQQGKVSGAVRTANDPSVCCGKSAVTSSSTGSGQA